MIFRIVATLVMAWCVASVSADERILSFHSAIGVNADGTIDVVESITVRAEGRQIQRGIFRDFPTDYKDRLGNHVRVGFEVQSVRRDGRTEPFHTQRVANGVRVYVGEASAYLASGVYTYEIAYRATHMLGYFDDHDELYWNVTGNGWDFTIDDVTATVRLPPGVSADAIEAVAYTGTTGSRGADYAAEVGMDSSAAFRTTRSLRPREGLTIAVLWPKGVVSEPSLVDKLTFLLSQNRGLFIALSAVLASLCYLFVSWARVGRDPPPGVVMPLYEPPPDISPASLRYIAKMRYDSGVLSAAILNLAVNGFITIKNDDGDYTLDRTDKTSDETLAPGERVLLAKLFTIRSSLWLDDSNHAVIGSAKKAHRRTLRNYHHRRFFVDNVGYLVPPILLIVGAFITVRAMDALSTATSLVFALGVIGTGIFWWLLKTPTPLGRKLLDKVDGFRRYLEYAEQDSLNLRHPPEETPELFERYLPYAQALDVEQPWAERFTNVLLTAEDKNGSHYQPSWYRGHFNSANPMRFVHTMGNSFSSAIASASKPPGSSSGGGGFSGGGGGGGGGGGW
ncbi:MAG: DUF2207 domain-containing protein [Pseudomonadota bacterium]